MVLTISVGASFFDTGGLEYKYNAGYTHVSGWTVFFFFLLHGCGMAAMLCDAIEILDVLYLLTTVF